MTVDFSNMAHAEASLVTWAEYFPVTDTCIVSGRNIRILPLATDT